jgi:hypothetical protein
MSGDAEKFRDEVNAVINRHAHENNLTYCQVVGVLHLILADVMDEARGKTDDW